MLYEFHFNWLQIPSLLTPFIVGIAFFSSVCWYSSEKSDSPHKIKRIAVDCVRWTGRIFRGIIGILCIILFIWLMFSHISDYCEKKDALKSGKVLTVEGYVEQYHAMPPTGHDTEHFKINDVYFQYSSYEVRNGYNRPACFGGAVTKNGQHLKIKYVESSSNENVILSIEKIT